MHSVLFERGIWDSDTRDGHPGAPVREPAASRTAGGGSDAYRRCEEEMGAECR
jgi:hypothetical protein